jgi:hypothetical protein
MFFDLSLNHADVVYYDPFADWEVNRSVGYRLTTTDDSDYGTHCSFIFDVSCSKAIRMLK